MKKFRGRHLIIDAYGVESNLLQNKKKMSKLLEDVPKELGMRILRKPIVAEIKSDMYPTVGLSGFVILYESHVSFHAWPEENYVALDVYSCRDFNGKEAAGYIKNYLGTKRMKVKSIIRG
ncbi:MAG: adenosylmethionine decarboxylase [Candidatus Wolfebacteria bacterium]|nr:adenosylmethionine decarboxylase [Candidatus Wolfebacteria bacterium]